MVMPLAHGQFDQTWNSTSTVVIFTVAEAWILKMLLENRHLANMMCHSVLSVFQCSLSRCYAHWLTPECAGGPDLFSTHKEFFGALPAAPPSRPRERRHAADSRYRTSGRGPGWASAFCVISISNSVLTSDSRAPPSGPSFSGVLPEENTKNARRRYFEKWKVSRLQFELKKLYSQFFTFTKSGKRWGVQGIPRNGLTFRGRRPIGDKDIVMVIAREWEGESGHPGRVTDLWENIICRKKRNRCFGEYFQQNISVILSFPSLFTDGWCTRKRQKIRKWHHGFIKLQTSFFLSVASCMRGLYAE